MPKRHLALLAATGLMVAIAGVGQTQVTMAGVVNGSPMKTWQVHGTVDAIAYSGSRVYVGGTFNSIDAPRGSGLASRPRHNLAAFDATTGDPLGWRPTTNGKVRTIKVTRNGGTVFIGGDFTSVSGVRRAHLATLSARTGQPRRFAPQIQGNIRSLALSPSGSDLYIGGAFTSADGSPRGHLASFRMPSGVLRAWAPRLSSSSRRRAAVNAIRLSHNGSVLYIGGAFTSVNGQPRRNGAAVAAGTGAVLPFRPLLRSLVLTVNLASKGSTVIFGGRGPGGYVAAYRSAKGARLWYRQLDGDVQAATVHAGGLYVGGHFDRVQKVGSGYLTRHHLAEFGVKGGTATRWRPTANSTPGVFAMASRPGYVCAGGSFTTINSRAQAGLALFAN